MNSLRTLYRRAARVVTLTSTILAIAMIAMLWGGILFKYQIQRDSDYREQLHNSYNLALLFEETALRAIGEVDKTLFYLRRLIEARYGTVDFHQLVSSSDILSEIIVQVAVIDKNGIMRASSAGPQPAKPIDLSDREHYRYHLGRDGDDLFVSRPVVGRASGKWSVQFTRRFRDKDGNFAGVIVASLNPEHLTRFYQSMEIGSTGSIALFGLDGVIRAAGGRNQDGVFNLGDDISSSQLMKELGERSEGTFVDNSGPGDGGRIITFRRIRGQPLAISVSVSEQQVYARSWNELLRNSWIGALLTLIIIGISDRGSRAQLGLRKAQTSLVRSQRRALQTSEQLRLTLDNMSQGIILVTKTGHIPVINQQAIHLLNLPESFLKTPPKFEQLVSFLEANGEFADTPVPEGVKLVDYLVRRDASGALVSYERTRPDGTVLEVKSTTLSDGGFVRTLTDVTRRREAQAAINRLVSEDVLTGLANRRLFQEELEKRAQLLSSGGQRAEDREGFALLSLDIDRFKIVNDSFGHPVGDALLREVAERLKETIRTDCVAARLGGDEFAILLPRVNSVEQPEALARRLNAVLGQPYYLSGNTLNVGCSVGIALAPTDGTNPDLLLKAADMALYAAKNAAGGTFRFFDTCMAEKAQIRGQMEIDLRRAVQEDEFELHYQPLQVISSGTISGLEALMRWRHPTKGLIPPSDFIPVAEDTGLITILGEWALRTACTQAKTWPDHLKVAVNVSAMQFRSGTLVSTVRSALADSGLPANRLELEITESILLGDCDMTASILDELRDLGIKISMDDFGTGYSSLSYLRTFPLDKIKIDRSFVRDLETKAGSDVIIRSIVDISKSLSMTTTAEGVETLEQIEMLTALGIDEIQGYWLSKPVPADALPELLRNLSSARVAA